MLHIYLCLPWCTFVVMYTHQRFLREPDSLLRALLESVISSRSLLLHLGCLANRINKNKNIDDLFYVLHHWLPLEAWFLNFLMASKHMISQKASQQEWSEWPGGWLRRRPRLRCKGEDPFSKLANSQWVGDWLACWLGG